MTQINEDWLTSDASQKICSAFESRGHKIYFVGGCVRNALLGQPVTDMDLSTDAEPQTVQEIAAEIGLKSIPTGLQHGTVTLVAQSVPYEITTFRTDVETDGRKATVAFTKDILEDAKRRDFTMNALYADARGQILDPINGLPDLQAKKISFIGDPNDRITEDYLRILRFFRFSAYYAEPMGGIDPDGLSACAYHADQIPTLSKERITSELLKLLSAPDPSMAVASMASSGVLAHTLPGEVASVLPVYVHLEAKHGLEVDPLVRLAALAGTPANDLRLSKAQETILKNLSTPYATPFETGYKLRGLAAKSLALSAASLGQEIDSKQRESLETGKASTFPVTASDLMPTFSGPALGEELRRLEAIWVGSKGKLSKAELLD